MTDVAELEEAELLLSAFPLSSRVFFAVGRPARPTFPAFPTSSFRVSDFRVLQSVARGSPFIRETSSFSLRPQNPAAANAQEFRTTAYVTRSTERSR